MTLHWTNHQTRDLRAFFAQGFSDEIIAKRIGRSAKAVGRQRYGMGLLRTRRRVWVRPAVPVSEPMTILLTHAEIPAFYLLGWRFVSFEPGGYRFEHPGHVRWPEERRAA